MSDASNRFAAPQHERFNGIEIRKDGDASDAACAAPQHERF